MSDETTTTTTATFIEKKKSNNDDKKTTKTPSSSRSSSSSRTGNIAFVTLTSSDGTKFELPLAAALQSKLVRNSLDLDDDDDNNDKNKNNPHKDEHDGGENPTPQEKNTVGNDGDDDNVVHLNVDLARVSTTCLTKVVEFLKHNHAVEKMKDIPFPLPGDSLVECIDQEWYREFITSVGEQEKDKGDEEENKKDLTNAVEELQQQQSTTNRDDDSNDNDNENIDDTAAAQRLDNDDHELFCLLDAANYMDIQSLMDLIVLRVTFHVIGKTAQELADYLHLPMPTPEDLDFCREHYPWILQEDNHPNNDTTITSPPATTATTRNNGT